MLQTNTNMPTQNTSLTSNEKRRATRTRCLRQGHCVFNNGCSDLSVLVRNISSTGAKLCGDELLCLPEEFELHIHDGFGGFASHWVKRVWTRADSIGVAFIDTARARSSPCQPSRPGGAAPTRTPGRV